MKGTIIAIIFSLLLIGGAIFLSSDRTSSPSVDNVKIENGVQIIEIQAKGGYLPRRSLAKSGLPTVLRINTSGTFDCSAILIIPSLGITKNLPQSGVTEIDLGNPILGRLNGSCGMGMYPVEIDFE